MENMILQGDCLEKLKELPDGIADCCVTSPPYYGLRDYGTGTWVGGDPNCDHSIAKIKTRFDFAMDSSSKQKTSLGTDVQKFKSVCPVCGAVRIDNQIGLEETPEKYVQKLVEVFREVRRVLKDDGTLWLNIGDSYAAERGGTHQPAETLAGGKHGYTEDGDIVNRGREQGYNPTRNASAIGLKHKDLIGIPWMLAFALRSDGWYLRQDIIWAKPNPMPESVKDRCTKSHEYIFLLSKSQKYYFDAESISEPICDSSKEKGSTRFGGNKYGDNKDKHYQTYSGNEWKPKYKNLEYNGQQNHSMHERRAEGLADIQYETRNKRDVWNVATQPLKIAHFATFPEKLIEPCILAGSRVGGAVLDPFFGSGTTGRVAVKLNRTYIGIELNPEYIEIEKERTNNIQMTLTGLI